MHNLIAKCMLVQGTWFSGPTSCSCGPVKFAWINKRLSILWYDKHMHQRSQMKTTKKISNQFYSKQTSEPKIDSDFNAVHRGQVTAHGSYHTLKPHKAIHHCLNQPAPQRNWLLFHTVMHHREKISRNIRFGTKITKKKTKTQRYSSRGGLGLVIHPASGR